ncbi:M23 family metallopeptidase [Brachybacterium sp. YJGR34]|uniref:M23 family metallopeptidase n=1 Tax=Brachybacterium sp. YJGR34 TaxID=2059911 RepID=UPI001E5D5098|nr:M23 family metallopeptidase [Brachybacterium sp. YJGR34]
MVGGTHRDAALPAGAVKAGVLGVLATATIAAPLAAAAGIDEGASQRGEALAQSAPAAVQAEPAAQKTSPVAIPAAGEAAAETRGEGDGASRDQERSTPAEAAAVDVTAVEDSSLEVEVPEPEPVEPEEPAEGTTAASSGGYIAPVEGPITSGYGGRMHPVLGYFKGHDGVDYGASCGTPVKAAKAGTVVAVEYHSASGNRVKVDHGNGVVTGYYHLQDFNTSVGATVQQGDTIGYVGSTGRSTGCHLHFAKMDEAGNYSDPMSILP